MSNVALPYVLLFFTCLCVCYVKIIDAGLPDHSKLLFIITRPHIPLQPLFDNQHGRYKHIKNFHSSAIYVMCHLFVSCDQDYFATVGPDYQRLLLFFKREVKFCDIIEKLKSEWSDITAFCFHHIEIETDFNHRADLAQYWYIPPADFNKNASLIGLTIDNGNCVVDVYNDDVNNNNFQFINVLIFADYFDCN